MARSETQIESFYRKYCDMVYRVCFSYLKNRHDAQDVTEEVFLKWMRCEVELENERHETGWLVMTASNLCKNHIRDRKYDRRDPPEIMDEIADEQSPESGEVLEAVLSLPDKYKTIVYLFYYEGMSTEEIARVTGKRSGSVRSGLTRARKMLGKILGEQ